MAYPYTEVRQERWQKGKGAEQDAVILREFKRKLSEDEGYISFFQERIRIEQQYIDQLSKLHDKTVGGDQFHDDVPHPRARMMSTARRAWFEVRDFTLREVDCREAFVNALKADVVAPLVSLRDEQTRIGNRIRDDLKNATASYEEWAFGKVPKLHDKYFHKSDAYEEHQRQEQAIANQAKLLSESSPLPPTPETKPHPYSRQAHHEHSGSSSSLVPPNQTGSWASGLSEAAEGSPTSPSLTFQNNQVPSESRALHVSQSQSGNRGRSGSTSALTSTVDAKSKEVLSDIAAHSKRGFAAIMQRLNDRRDDDTSPTHEDSLSRAGTVRRGSVRNANNAAKTAKLRRDAEDADKTYRHSVFHLESLRLHRHKLHQSAITSLGLYNDELNAVLTVTMRAFADATHGTAWTMAQSTEVINNSVKSVNKEQDTQLFRSRLPVLPRSPPMLYESYYVGKCRSLIFGVSLTDYDFARGEGGDYGRPPLIVEKCIAFLDAHALEREGLYRVSAKQADLKRLVQEIEVNEEAVHFTPERDPNLVAAVLGMYLRELPEPLFPLPQSERWKWMENREAHIESGFSTLRSRLRRLPPIHQTTFQAIIEHLHRVVMHSGKNLMDAFNISTVLNNAIFGTSGGEKREVGPDSLTKHHQPDTVLEDMLTQPDLLFGQNQAGQHSELAVPNASNIGSAHTRFQYMARDAELVQPLARMDIGRPSLDETANGIGLFTPDSELQLLFDASKIPPLLKETIGDDLHARPLASDDFLRSHFGLLSTLSTAPALAPTVYTSLFNAMRTCNDTYFVLVIVEKESDMIVASGTVVKERKFIHGGGYAGHIEDIVVSPMMQGRGLGIKLVSALRELATSMGCYKTILDCQEAKIQFYEKCGFTLRGRQMAYYAPTAAPPRKESLAPRDPLSRQPSTSQPPPPNEKDTEPDLYEHEWEAYQNAYGKDRGNNDHDPGHNYTYETESLAETEGTNVTYHFPTASQSSTPVNGSNGTLTPSGLGPGSLLRSRSHSHPRA